MKTTRIISGLLLVAALPVMVMAETEAEETETMTVTATRTPSTVDDAVSSVTVITREDIERMQAQNVPDALRGVAGLDISNQGGPGQLTTFFLRGTNSNQVLVLVDGVKVGSATTGLTQFENIPIGQVERIEVVRGPRASLYGSEALGGVIQIFTRRGGGELRPYASLGGSIGDLHSVRSNIGVSGGGDNAWFNLNFTGFWTGGIDSCSTPPGVMAGCFAFDPDRDGSHYGSGSLRAGYRFDNNAEVEVHYLQTGGFTEFDGSFQNESEYTNTVVGGQVKFSPLSRWNLTLNAGRSMDETENLLDGAFASRFDTTRDTISVQNDVLLAPNHLLTLAFDYQKDKVDSDTAFVVNSRDNRGYFGQYQGGFGRFDIEASVRHDDNEQFGGHTTGGAGFGFALTQWLRLTASYGTAFKAPTFNDLYFPFGFGNPDLDPEKSESFEIGLRGRHDWGRWSLNAYQTNIDDLISLDEFFVPRNISRARIRGLEGTVTTQLHGFDIHAAMTLLDAVNRTPGPNRGNELPRRAREQLRLDIDRAIGRFSAGTTVYASGRRFDDAANNERMGGYVTLDLRGEYRPHRDWRVQGRIANLLDKEYETARFFNQPGRTFFLTVVYQPQIGD